MEESMRKPLLLMVAAVGGIVLLWRPSAAFGDGGSVRWKDIIGIVQTGNIVGSGTGKVTGGLLPWHTTGGRAAVNLATGDLHFTVRGLVLAGGNFIGTRADVAQVRGTLVCDTTGIANGNSTLVDTDLVPLSLQGIARFSGNVGPLPDACLNSPNVAFLVRSARGLWIANGSVRVLEGEDEEE
jgi:hypothetical protein